jgi:predicted N-acetyltransferase YhbS
VNLKIRTERQIEYRAVEELTREAFWNIHVPGCNEHFCLHNMRSHKDFIPELDFVAEQDGKIVGNIVYTRGVIENNGKSHEVISFGPISILPAYQSQGIGSALIKHSFEKARSMGFTSVFIYGDPRYYHRFGFRCAEKWDIMTSWGKYAVALMAVELVQGALQGISGKFIESQSFAVDEAEFQKYESTFPPKEKAVIESQTEFKILSSLMY